MRAGWVAGIAEGGRGEGGGGYFCRYGHDAGAGAGAELRLTYLATWLEPRCDLLQPVPGTFPGAERGNTWPTAGVSPGALGRKLDTE